MIGRVLVIAGSDSSGGAGVQADIKTVSALGAYASSALTMVTVQDTNGISDIHEVPPHVVSGQICAVLSDIGTDAIKTGALGSIDVIHAVAMEIERSAHDVPLVVDPILTATGGGSLMDRGALGVFKAELVLQADLITPNITEAEFLSGSEITCVADMKRMGERLLTLGPPAVLITGGHLKSDQVTDVLMTLEETIEFSSPRLRTHNDHGTGCTLASAIATGLAQKMSLVPAIERARAYVQEALATAPGLGRGRGPLNHMHTLKSL